ncbi:MAG: DUF6090 family protein [Phaeodactylibacter sp.]|uniref:DUF6090 family protein n=1 Tax=Phaeodactylibacter sp. TaxID=1940289 RepID=UPI0032EEFB34
MENRIVYLLQKIAIVVIGVLIAVSINNFKEKANNKRFFAKTLQAIETEIKLGQSAVDEVLKRHFDVLAGLENDISEKEQTLGEQLSSLGGIQFPFVKNISLRFFISNKAELVDFELISQLMEIETHSHTLSDKMNRLGDFAYAHINDKEQETKITFAYLLSDVIDSEQALLESYSSFLDNHKPLLQQSAQRQ